MAMAAARILRRAVFFLCFFIITDTSFGEKTTFKTIQESRKLYYEENQMVFPSDTFVTRKDTPNGDIPIVNPTPPGTTPIVNPTSPPPPATIGGGGGGGENPIGGGGQSPPMGGGGGGQNPPIGGGGGGGQNPPIGGGGGGGGQNPTIGGGGGGGGQNPAIGGGGGGGSWCIASSGASETALQVALDYACGFGGADCSAIQPNAACYEPNTVRDHASYAFNNYYQKNPSPTSCVFGGTAQLTNTDPSHGNCKFASSSGTPTTTPPSAPTIPMTPPSTTSPVNPYTPGGDGSEPAGFDYGPTGSPNSAGNVSFSLMLLVFLAAGVKFV